MNIQQQLEQHTNKLLFDCTDNEIYEALVCLIDEMKAKIKNEKHKRKAYYFSAEFLEGKRLKIDLVALGIFKEIAEVLEKNGKNIENIYECECEPSLGNGGLGRLAACFMDSAAHLGLPCDGIGILYHHGLFLQKFRDNKQKEEDNPWIESSRILRKTDTVYDVDFGRFGIVRGYRYIIDIIGKRVNHLNLFDTEDNNPLTKNLYPDDSTPQGRQLRLCQEYFMVSCGVQLILDEALLMGSDLSDLDKYAVVQINDTHPSLVIPELIYQLGKRGTGRNDAIEIVKNMCAYTNHTILREALEKWDIKVMEEVVPHLIPIIRDLSERVGNGDAEIIDGDGNCHMAAMDIHYGMSVNGVASLHTEILKKTELLPFYKIYPEKFNNKTNGISMRRWLMSINPALTEFITSLIGDGFTKDFTRLQNLLQFKDDRKVLERINKIKDKNKEVLRNRLIGEDVPENAIFDVQIKRIHEYKRQQMNLLYLINMYLDIKRGIIPKRPVCAIFGGKAAPAYTIAKDVIHAILCLSEIIRRESAVTPHLKVIMVENYNVTKAEMIIPAADISEQISLASKEASGTGNMKLMANGAVTLGTRDGANIEIGDLVGEENIYFFGDTSDRVMERYKRGNYNPREYYEKLPRIREAVDFLAGKEMTEVGDKENLSRLHRELTGKDYFMTFPDYCDYEKTRNKILNDFENREAWARMCLINIAKSGYFSADRTIAEYNNEIWKLGEKYGKN